MKIAIISSSVRDGRLSHRVALFVSHYLAGQGFEVDMLDLKAFNFPIFSERYAMQTNPPLALVDFTARLVAADAVWIVSPIYNGSYPSSLKNVIDLYFKEWQRKRVALSVVTAGGVVPMPAVDKLQTLLYKLGAVVAPASHTVIEVGNTFNEDGVAENSAAVEKFLVLTLSELMDLCRK